MNPQHQTVHELIAAQVARTPTRVAVEFEDRWLTYAELDCRSSKVAHYLRAMGVGPDVLVAICVERSLEMLVGLLGILKAGGAYVPLDPAYPVERLAYMLQDSRALVLMTEGDRVTRLPEHGAKIVCLDTDWAAIAAEPGERLDNSATGANRAYVIYTSGSTGRPKGVEIPHSAVVNLLCSMRDKPGLTAEDRLLSVTTVSFDISVLELFLPLSVGARIILVSRVTASDGVQLAHELVETGATMMQATPTTWYMLLEAEWSGNPHFRIICGGETLPRELAERLLPRCGELWNLYGPTEATVWATLQRVQTGQAAVPIGWPIANTEVYVLDEQGRQSGVDSPGEIHLGGAGLARGYLDRPELTAERFIRHPFDSRPGARLYRTGDLGRFRADGSLDHLGRMDQQVKVRGFRIELGEIEAVLERQPSVRQAIVLAREDVPGDKRLVAYIAPATGPRTNIRMLRETLRLTLPDHMIPATFVFIDKFPLTPNGKVNRNALPAPGPQRPHLQDYVAPRTSNEERLAATCAEVLRVDRVGIQDNFFDLGADSIKLAQVVARIYDAFHTELSLRILFENPTVASLMPALECAPSGDPSALQAPIRAVSRTRRLPLSFSQERVWFIHQLNPENLAYNFQSTIRFQGPLDVPALERSLSEIVRRHEIFRTTFPVVDDQPTQLIHAAEAFSLPVVDLSQLAENERDTAAREWCEREFQKRFDITRLPLAQWTLLKHSQNDHVLAHREHHLVHDGWSFNVFLRELMEIYSAFASGRPSPLPELPIQFADFAAWQRHWMQGEVAESQVAYWKQRLASMPGLLELPADRPRPKSQTFRGAAPRAEIPLELCAALRVLSRKRNCTLFMTTFAGFVALLHHYTKRGEVTVGTFFANRRRHESERLIGMILNNGVIRTSLAADPPVVELLDQVRALVLEGAHYQDVPFDHVVNSIQPRRDPSYNPLFQVAFSFHDEPMPEQGPPGINVEVTPVISNGSAKFDLGVIVIPHSAQHLGLRQGSEADGLTMIWEHSTDLFDNATILRMIRHYLSLLQAMVSDPERRISELLSEDLPHYRSHDAASPSALPAPGVGPTPLEAYVSPATDLERQIAAIWQDVLVTERVGRNDNFFGLGGHSLHATRIINRLQAAIGVAVPLRSIFDAPTVAGLALSIAERPESECLNE